MKRLFYSLIIAALISTLALGAEVRKLGVNDLQYGANVVSPAGHNVIGIQPIDVRAYGAKGDGITDDTSSLAAAVTASIGKSLLIPAGTFTTTTALTYDANTGPVSIMGTGASSILKLTGTNNKGIYISATAGATVNMVTIKDLQIQSATSSSSTAGIHLDGIAIYHLSNIVIDGADKMTYGIQFTGTQQGEIDGGYIHDVLTGILFEISGVIGSNACDMHGVSLASEDINIDLDGAGDTFIRGNHLVRAPVSIDIHGTSPGGGNPIIAYNHIEEYTTAGIRIRDHAERVHINGNSFFENISGGTDILATHGSNHVIIANQFTGGISLSSSVADSIFAYNVLSSGVVSPTFSDNSTRLRKQSNFDIGAGVVVGSRGNTLYDNLIITSQTAVVAGDILKLVPNQSYGGNWGMKIEPSGSGTDSVYIQLNDIVFSGVAGGNAAFVKSSPSGDIWARFDTNGLEVMDVPELADNAAALGAGYTAGRIYRTGDTLKIVH